MTTRTPHPTPSLPEGEGKKRGEEGSAPRKARKAAAGTVPERARAALCLADSPKRGRGALGSPTPRRGGAPRARRGVARPLLDWLLPRDITRLGQKSRRERELEPQRRGSCGRSRGRPSAPRPRPRPAPAAAPPARPPGPPSVRPSVRREGRQRGGGANLVSDSAGAGAALGPGGCRVPGLPRGAPVAGCCCTYPPTHPGQSAPGPPRSLEGRPTRGPLRRLRQVRLREGGAGIQEVRGVCQSIAPPSQGQAAAVEEGPGPAPQPFRLAALLCGAPLAGAPKCPFLASFLLPPPCPSAQPAYSDPGVLHLRP